VARDSKSTAPGCATAPVLEGARREVEKGAEAKEALAEEAGLEAGSMAAVGEAGREAEVN